MRRLTWFAFASVTFALTVTGCGTSMRPGDASDSSHDATEAAVDGNSGLDTQDIVSNPDVPMSDGRPARCGNGFVEPGEECDDGNGSSDDDCLPTCRLACGDGVRNASEQCDTAIPAGMPGACPTACDDGMACTTDSLSGSGCQVTCAHGAITGPANGDGCCPSGANAVTDNDCTPTCGNGIVEMGETCDTGIASGTAGACPTMCSDGVACTADTLVGGGTCTAACSSTPITAPANGDGCCPAGANAGNDNDCSPSCGDGAVSAGESCDTAIAAGMPGACPTSCSDSMACTADSLMSAGTCNAMCVFTAITMTMPGDGCCPPGATSLNDSDCLPACGNGVVEMGETCDTMIAAGMPGACPASCNDSVACTRDALVGGGTCTAACTFTPITAPTNGDGCCPAGANAGNDNDCSSSCGDGVVSGGETCDTAIASGTTGACPTACNDGMVCTTDRLVSAGTCNAACTFTPITVPANGDGCCPPGANATNDSDCTARCGNGVVESGETCDTSIAAGMPGACPTACSDGMACTRDTLSNAGTCTAACTFPAITAPMNGDGCCPAGASVANDNDCSARCGDGVVSSGETCDTAIAAGTTGACPTTCNDAMVCTRDTLMSAGTCSATCAFAPITAPTNGDGCCPPGATSLNDNDCMPRCGNSVVEAGEMCDDGNMTSGDGCSSTCQNEVMATAFRINSLTLKDPHAFTRVLFCIDITTQLNNQIATAVTTDGDGDGDLDLSLVSVFRPLNQTATSTPMDIVFPDCTAPATTTRCTLPAGGTVVNSNANNQATGTCLATLTGTTRSTYGTITTPTGPCFSSDQETITLSLGGVPLTLREARIGATYSGVPASQLINGLIRGFVTQADADATVLPSTIMVVGGMRLSAILPGGTGNCQTYSDMDTAMDGTRGWYFYLNFTAVPVPYSP